MSHNESQLVTISHSDSVSLLVHALPFMHHNIVDIMIVSSSATTTTGNTIAMAMVVTAIIEYYKVYE